MATKTYRFDSRYLQLLLPLWKVYRTLFTHTLMKCSEGQMVPSIRAMESRGMFNNVTNSLGVFWSMLGLSDKPTSSDRPSGDKNISSYIDQAEAAIKENNLKAAEALLERALTLASRINDPGVTCIYDMLATLAYRLGNADRAEEILVQVIEKLKEAKFPPSHNTVVNYELKLARIYSAMGRKTLAESSFRKCVAAQEMKYGTGQKDEESSLLWLNILFWFGKFLTVQKRYAEAKQAFEKAYTLSADLKSIDTQQVMVMLYHLGEVSYASGENVGRRSSVYKTVDIECTQVTLSQTGMEDEALKYLMNGVILGRAIHSRDVPSYCNKISLVYFQKGKLGEAKKWAEKAKKLSRSRDSKGTQKEAEELLKKIDDASNKLAI